MGTKTQTTIGRPLVPAAEVHAVCCLAWFFSPPEFYSWVALTSINLFAWQNKTLVDLQVVEEQLRDTKQLIFKKRRRKHSRRLTAHRQARLLIQLVSNSSSAALDIYFRSILTRALACPQQLTSLRIVDIISV